MSESWIRFGGTLLKRNQPCVLRDGTTLYADIYRPQAQSDYPVLLMRQPYGRRIASTVTQAHPVWYVHQGYMVVIQDVRGRGDSAGKFVPYVNEAEDGYDSVEWAAALPYSNGKVGMYGFSYQGATQWAAASLRPPQLVAIAPSMCAADIYSGSVYSPGTFKLQNFLPWAFQLARDEARRLGDSKAEQICSSIMKNPATILTELPLIDEHPLLLKYAPYYYDWLNNPDYNDYWERQNWLKPFVEQPIPTFQVGGWYDYLLSGTIQSFEALQDKPRTSALFHNLMIGPWMHIPWGRKAGGIDHGPAADGDVHRKQAQWFRYWLQEKREINLCDEPAVSYFERQSNVWRSADKLPTAASPSTESRYYIIGSVKPANGSSGGGKLLTALPERSINPTAADVFVYDARLPMPNDSYLPVDRSGLQERYEILVYTGEPLEQTLCLFGKPKVTVAYQTLDGPTDLVATLTLLQEDGQAQFLSIGRAEAGKADTQTDEQVDEWSTIEITLRSVAVACMPGTALRLELTGSAFPLFNRHPNSSKGIAVHTADAGDLGIATVAIASGEGARCYMDLPYSIGGASNVSKI